MKRLSFETEVRDRVSWRLNTRAGNESDIAFFIRTLNPSSSSSTEDVQETTRVLYPEKGADITGVDPTRPANLGQHIVMQVQPGE